MIKFFPDVSEEGAASIFRVEEFNPVVCWNVICWRKDRERVRLQEFCLFYLSQIKSTKKNTTWYLHNRQISFSQSFQYSPELNYVTVKMDAVS